MCFKVNSSENTINTNAFQGSAFSPRCESIPPQNISSKEQGHQILTKESGNFSTKDSNSISSKDSSNPPHKPLQNIQIPPFTPLPVPQPTSLPKVQSISAFQSTINQIEEKGSSFKRVKVYYCDNVKQGKKIFENENNNGDMDINTIEEPTIFHLESFQPKTKMIQKHNLITSNKTCTCTKTRCLKKYCECLANNQFCFNCNCVDCHNIPAYQQEKLNENTEIITCTCTKSNCNKKYCECYKAGRKCNFNCRCLNCVNRNEESTNNLDESGISKTSQKQNKNIDDFIIERISILIEKGIIKIKKETIMLDQDKEENCIKENKEFSPLLNHKRVRAKVLFHMNSNDNCNNNSTISQ